jgi:uncharacterized membrane protein HdeD (DUF308 family)
MKAKTRNYYLIPVFSLALGIIMVLFPEFVQTALNYILGIILLIISIFLSVPYLKAGDFRNWTLLIPASLVGAFGLFFILYPGLFTRILWVFIGSILLLDAIGKFFSSFEMRLSNPRAYRVNIVCAAATLVIASLLIFTPFAERAMITVSGAFLIANAVFDIVAFINLANFKRKNKKSNAKKNQDSNIVSEQNFDD